MKTEESFCNSTYEDQIHIVERELSAFISAVTQLVGSRGGNTLGGRLAR